MTLSILEISLPMQRSHDSIPQAVKVKNWCVNLSYHEWSPRKLMINMHREITNIL